MDHGDELIIHMNIHYLGDIKNAEISIVVKSQEMNPVAEIKSGLSTSMEPSS